MKLLCIFFLLLLTCKTGVTQSSIDSLLLRLDMAIEKNKNFSEQKEERIAGLKRKVAKERSATDLYNLNQYLYEEYIAYVCDSAIFYLNNNIALAQALNDKERLCETNLLLSHLLGSSGMYKEAVDVLNSINREKLPKYLIVDYYNTNYHVYGEMSFYTQDKRSSAEYRRIADNYRDSLIIVLPEGSDLKLIIQEAVYRDMKQTDEARKINDIRLSETQSGTRDYSIVTYHRALSYRNDGNAEEVKRYLALSAISDIHAAIKDHASLWMLASILYEEGKIERAYHYMRFSWSETMFYNARLRSLQSAGILSLIDKTYQAMIEKQNHQLRNYLITISILFITLMAAAGYIFSQVKKLSAARNNLQNANLQLKELNEELIQTNKCLELTNMDLYESNLIKEEYIGRFIKLCSTYIDKLDTYRRMVKRKITEGKIADLLKMVQSQEVLENELKELYVNFDTAFLQIFPDFVNKFNKLLNDDERITLKKGELLNTELRIFALIRLGIDNSCQIADFLRYSVNTIYNYRAKIKNKARVEREDFETLVKNIK